MVSGSHEFTVAEMHSAFKSPPRGGSRYCQTGVVSIFAESGLIYWFIHVGSQRNKKGYNENSKKFFLTVLHSQLIQVPQVILGFPDFVNLFFLPGLPQTNVDMTDTKMILKFYILG
jgi:hypothetical protein